MDRLELDATAQKPHRTKIFLGLVFVLYLWDIAFFLGIRDPAEIPHPFAVFRSLGDIVFFRGFGSMLREIIFTFVSGGLLGIVIGATILYTPSLTGTTLRFLRIAVWVPFIIAYAIFAPLFWGIMTAMLCAAYHYLGARFILKIRPSEAWSWAARESLLQTLLFCLISQIWVDHWRWFDFSAPQRPGTGWAMFTVLAALVALINWSFRSTLAVTATNHALLQVNNINGPRGRLQYRLNNLRLEPEDCLVFLTIALLAVWLLFYTLDLGILGTSLRSVLIAVFNLLVAREIWADMGLSLSEILLGITLSSSLALGLLILPAKANLKNLLFSLLPHTYISTMILWWVLVLGMPGLLYFWHKVVAVGCLTFFPCFQSLWATREHPLTYRLLMTTDAALPFAFIAMAFGEAMAATKGLGFSMIVATASRQTDKAVAVFLITFVLLVGLLSCLRFTARRLSSSLTVCENATA